MLNLLKNSVLCSDEVISLQVSTTSESNNSTGAILFLNKAGSIVSILLSKDGLW